MIRLSLYLFCLLLISCSTSEPLTESLPKSVGAEEEETTGVQKPDWYDGAPAGQLTDETLAGYTTMLVSDEQWAARALRQEATTELRRWIDEELEGIRTAVASEEAALTATDFIYSLRLAVNRLDLLPSEERQESYRSEEGVYHLFYRLDVSSSDVKRQLEQELSSRFAAAWSRLAREEPIANW